MNGNNDNFPISLIIGAAALGSALILAYLHSVFKKKEGLPRETSESITNLFSVTKKDEPLLDKFEPMYPTSCPNSPNGENLTNAVDLVEKNSSFFHTVGKNFHSFLIKYTPESVAETLSNPETLTVAGYLSIFSGGAFFSYFLTSQAILWTLSKNNSKNEMFTTESSRLKKD